MNTIHNSNESQRRHTNFISNLMNFPLQRKTITIETSSINRKSGVFFNILKKNLHEKLITNYKASNKISFSERNKIRSVTLTKSKLDSNYTGNFLNQYNSENDFLKKESNASINYLSMIKQEVEKFQKGHSPIKKKYDKKRIKFKLKDLMIMNPYHYVPKQVIFSPIITDNLINSRFNKTSKKKTIESESNKSDSTFLKTSYNKGKKRKVIESQTISFNDNYFNSGELIWRLIGRIMITKGVTSFKQAVRYEALTKVWKTHSLIIERLLVNYINFKWFFEKQNNIDEKVLMEFLSLLKLNNNKGHEDFCKKIILIFDEEGYGFIKIKEFFFIMNLTSQSSINYEKMNFMTFLFEDINRLNKKRTINIEEIPNNFRIILNHETYRKDLKKLFDNVKSEFLHGRRLNNNSELNYVQRNQVLKFLLENEFIKSIIKRFYRDYSKAHSSYNDEIMNGFYATMRNSKRMLNIHDIVKHCENDYTVLEKALKAIENKLNNENQIIDFENYLKEEKEYSKI